MDGIDVFLIPIEIVRQRQCLGLQEIDFGGFVFVEKPDIFLAGRWNGVFDKNDQKRILGFVFNVGNPGSGFQFPLFDKRKGQLPAVKIVVRIDQAILDHLLIEFIPQEFVIRPSQTVGLTECFTKTPESQ